MEAEPGLGNHAPPPQAARDPDVVVQGAQERLLAAEGSLGSFSLCSRAPCAVGHAMGSRVLGQGRRLDVEVVEALHGLHRPRLEVGEAARETVREGPQRH